MRARYACFFCECLLHEGGSCCFLVLPPLPPQREADAEGEEDDEEPGDEDDPHDVGEGGTETLLARRREQQRGREADDQADDAHVEVALQLEAHELPERHETGLEEAILHKDEEQQRVAQRARAAGHRAAVPVVAVAIELRIQGQGAGDALHGEEDDGKGRAHALGKGKVCLRLRNLGAQLFREEAVAHEDVLDTHEDERNEARDDEFDHRRQHFP